MPKTEYVEKTIYNIEGVNVDFIKDGKNVRDEVRLPCNYKAAKATKNAYNISEFKEKLKNNFRVMILMCMMETGISAGEIGF